MVDENYSFILPSKSQVLVDKWNITDKFKYRVVQYPAAVRLASPSPRNKRPFRSFTVTLKPRTNIKNKRNYTYSFSSSFIAVLPFSRVTFKLRATALSCNQNEKVNLLIQKEKTNKY